MTPPIPAVPADVTTRGDLVAPTSGDPYVQARLVAASNRAHQPVSLAERAVRLGPALVAESGARVGKLLFQTLSVARGERALDLPVAAPTTEGPEVRQHRGPVVEWWRSLDGGLEHGLTIRERLPGAETLRVTVATGAHGARARADGTIELHGPDAETLATYGGLYVSDAVGTALPARLVATSEGQVSIEVDDTDAAYPIVVDPFVEVSEWSQQYPANYLTLSRDGSRLLFLGYVMPVGVLMNVAVRSGTSWTGEHGFDFDPNWDSQAVYAAMDADAQYIVVIQEFSTSMATFRRSGTLWSFAGSIRPPVGSTTFGPVNLSSDGTRASLMSYGGGGPLRFVVYETTDQGASWNLASDSGSLAPVAPDFIDVRSEDDVIVSPDGAFAVTGTYVFQRNGSSWSLESSLGTAPGARSARRSAFAASDRIITSDPATDTLTAFHRVGNAWMAVPIVPTTPFVDLDAFGVSANGRRIVTLGTDDVARVFDYASGQYTEVTTASARWSGSYQRFAGITDDRTRIVTPSGIWRLEGDRGGACDAPNQCGAGLTCVDGRCCESACGGSDTDCMACAASLTGVADGTCAPLKLGVAETVVCRVGNGGCDLDDRCDPSTVTCPDSVRPSGFVCRPEAGPCDSPEVCDGSDRTCPGDAFEPSGNLCGVGTGDCSGPGTCPGDSPTCSAPTLKAAGTVCRAATGPCDAEDTCNGLTDVCVDTFAPATTACGQVPNGPCDAPDHCAGDSNLCLSVVAAAGTTCAPSLGACDTADVCNGVSTFCPVGPVRPPGYLCRPSAGPCDQAEFCDGNAATCGPDAVLSSDTICRAPSGLCDLPEYCDGSTSGCANNVIAPPGAVCRPASGACDAPETCTGLSASCPADAVLTGGTVCRAASGTCDVPEVCDGVAAGCPGNAVLADGTPCRPSLGSCDPAESCDGASPACPADVLSPAGTVCRAAAPTDVCDVSESCTGSTASCPADAFLPAGTECRPARDACDVAESCAGSAACPADLFAANGTVCDDGLQCTVASACQAGDCSSSVALDCSDGDDCTTDACVEPTGCSHFPVPACIVDAGRDGAVTDLGLGGDSSVVPDTGMGTPTTGGCSCRAAATREAPPGALGATCGVVALGLSLRRRARRARDAGMGSGAHPCPRGWRGGDGARSVS